MKPAVIKKRSHGNQTATLTVRTGKKGGGRLLGVVQSKPITRYPLKPGKAT